MTDRPNADRPWKAALGEAERARVATAFAADAELEGDLDVILEGLAPKRRAAFVERFVAGLAETERGSTALLLALGGLARAARLQGDRTQATRSADRPTPRTRVGEVARRCCGRPRPGSSRHARRSTRRRAR